MLRAVVKVPPGKSIDENLNGKGRAAEAGSETLSMRRKPGAETRETPEP
jgi:hypothetical protein